MNFVIELFAAHTALQCALVLSIIGAVGLALGKLRLCGVSLGVAFVFFVGILAGHLGFTVDHQMLLFAENFGLIVFVYALGLQVGPGFFSSMRREGLSLNLWGLGVIVSGSLLALLLCQLLPISIADMMGLLCGATTNTPALGAAQQTLSMYGMDGNGAALGCAVTYPLGVVGVILAILLIRKLFVAPARVVVTAHADENATYIAAYDVVNPAIAGKNLAQITQMTHIKFIISRMWRGNDVIVPHSTTVLRMGDRVLAVTTKQEMAAVEILFGKREPEDWNNRNIDWNALDPDVESREVVLSRPNFNGRLLGHLHLRATYGVNVSRVTRGGVKLLATNDLCLHYGDRLTVVGHVANLNNVTRYLGNAVKNLDEPNLGAIFLGIILGLVLGAIPLELPGMALPVKMGIAGGPIVVGILMGAFGPRMHLLTYTTPSANLMLRKLGLSLYLACLGLDAGSHFFETIVRPEGLLWIVAGFALTLLPVLLVGLLLLRFTKFDYGTICGILSGSMANPMALNYANDTIPSDAPSVSYATVYPLSMFLRVISVQIMLMALL